MRQLFRNGVIYSMDEQNACHNAMLIENGRIAAIGEYEDVRRQAESGGEKASEVDLNGRTVLPGFIDSHMHLLEYGLTKGKVYLGGARSKEELLTLLKDALLERGPAKTGEASGESEERWLIGYGFNQDYFRTETGEPGQIPTREDLDLVSRDVPILILRACIHIAVANTRALERNGLMKKGLVMEGGSFDSGEDGYPNGIVRENAIERLYDAIPECGADEIKEALRRAMKELAVYGITAVHSDDFTEAGSWKEVVRAYREMEEAGEMTVRVFEQCQFFRAGEFEEFLGAGMWKEDRRNPEAFFLPVSVKIIEDGSLGARTAYMRRDYADDPGNRGMLLIPEEKLYQYMRSIHHAGIPMAVHAIGDGTIELILNLYRRLEEEEPKGLRHGIVHCQITDEELLRRFAKQKVSAYIQPIFLHYDLHIAESRVGRELASTSYAWRTLVEEGVPVSGGSDCPVEFFNVMEGIYCAVTRKDLNQVPKEGFHPEQRLTVQQAVRIFTNGGAYAANAEEYLGSLEPGKLADFVVLSENIFECEADRIKEIKVLETYIGGKPLLSGKA